MVVNETGLANTTLARVRDNLNACEGGAPTDTYPIPVHAEMPTIPSNVERMSDGAIAELHADYVRYQQHISCKVAEARGDVRQLEVRYDAIVYSVRREWRDRGYNREELKEIVETESEVVYAKAGLATAKTVCDHFEALAKGADSALRMITDERFRRKSLDLSGAANPHRSSSPRTPGASGRRRRPSGSNK